MAYSTSLRLSLGFTTFFRRYPSRSCDPGSVQRTFVSAYGFLLPALLSILMLLHPYRRIWSFCGGIPVLHRSHGSPSNMWPRGRLQHRAAKPLRSFIRLDAHWRNGATRLYRHHLVLGNPGLRPSSLAKTRQTSYLGNGFFRNPLSNLSHFLRTFCHWRDLCLVPRIGNFNYRHPLGGNAPIPR